MFKSKIIKIIILFVLLINIPIISFADDNDEVEYMQNEIENLIVESSANVTQEPAVNARAAIIYDRTTKQIIWGKNENSIKQMASTTKIMTAIVVIENSNLSDIVTISKKAALTGGSRLKISTGDKVSVNDLLYGLMLRSGNDAAVALAEHVGGSVEGFSVLMNNKAKQLGLNNTNFVTPHGLDNQNHYTTAYELALLTDYALDNKTFAKIVNTKIATISVNGNARNIYNTNELLGNINGVNGVKTGFTNGAGRCLVTSCTRDNNQIITVVLGCDTKKQRTQDSAKLIEYTFKNYKRIDLEEKIKEEFENWKQINQKRIYINKAKNENVKLELEKIEIPKIPMKVGEEKDLTIQINAVYNYEAPLLANTKIGNIIVKKKDEIIQTVDIFIKEEVPRKTVLDYLMELFTVIPNYDLIS